MNGPNSIIYNWSSKRLFFSKLFNEERSYVEVFSLRHYLKWQLTKGTSPSGNFPNVQISKRQLSKGISPSGNFSNVQISKRQLPKGISPSGNFPNVQISKRQLPKGISPSENKINLLILVFIIKLIKFLIGTLQCKNLEFI